MPEKQPFPLISTAIRQGDILNLQLLFARYPDAIKMVIPVWSSWLHYAAGNGSLDVVKYLVGVGFDINEKDHRDGQMPISYAASNDRADVVKYLLDQGAELDTSASIRNPLFVGTLTEPRSLEVVRLLLAAGIDSKVRYHTKSMDGYDAVAYALEAGHIECAQMIALWNAGGDIEEANAAMIEAQLIMRRNNKKDNIIPTDLLQAMRITEADREKLRVM